MLRKENLSILFLASQALAEDYPDFNFPEPDYDPRDIHECYQEEPCENSTFYYDELACTCFSKG